MARRKWKNSAFVCADIGQILDSCTKFGGVWRADIDKFANRSWVMSQQLHYLLMRTRRAAFYYPEPVDYSTIHAVCRECATAAGFVPKDKVVGVWISECGICHERKPCTNLHHDWRRKKEGGAE